MSKRERNYHLAGWLLFLVCAGFFIISAALSGDMLYLVGSIIFLVACIVFVIPLIWTGRPRRSGLAQREAREADRTTPAE
jgi:predicted membrane channel-forming protein YqfA (hemolysin III family)